MDGLLKRVYEWATRDSNPWPAACKLTAKRYPHTHILWIPLKTKSVVFRSINWQKNNWFGLLSIPFKMALQAALCGWGTRIRTSIDWSRISCPTVERYPNVCSRSFSFTKSIILYLPLIVNPLTGKSQFFLPASTIAIPALHGIQYP